MNQRHLDWLAARLLIAVYDTNQETPEMSVLELKDALKDIPGIEELTVGYAPSGNQVLGLANLSIEVGPMASNEEIRSALQSPLIPTANTKVTMSSKLQGLASKIAQLRHDAEFEAEKLDTKIEGASARMPGVFSGAHGAIDGITKHVDDVEAMLTEIQVATNGAPA